jgi:hypothetical protein
MSTVDRVHGSTVYRLTVFIKQGPPRRRSTVWIQNRERVHPDLILTVDSRSDGGEHCGGSGATLHAAARVADHQCAASPVLLFTTRDGKSLNQRK